MSPHNTLKLCPPQFAYTWTQNLDTEIVYFFPLSYSSVLHKEYVYFKSFVSFLTLAGLELACVQ
jgi:hypothetical protein